MTRDRGKDMVMEKKKKKDRIKDRVTHTGDDTGRLTCSHWLCSLHSLH